MAIILYKAGGGINIRGIPCQFQICNPFSYLHLLDQGWFYTPEECYAEEKEEEIAEDTTEETTGTEMEADQELIENDIRLAAKVAGISHWHNKSIDRLTKELEELEDGEQSED